jgi:molybdopterin biosynthesis enzyme
VVRARLARSTKAAAKRTDYQRGRLAQDEQGWVFEPLANQESGNLASIVTINGLGVIPAGAGLLAAGSVIEVECLNLGA